MAKTHIHRYPLINMGKALSHQVKPQGVFGHPLALREMVRAAA
jgi:hypothetical protein